MQSNGTNLRRVYETKFQGECKTKLNQFWKIKGMNQKFNVSLWRHILILSLPYLRYLTHCWYSAFPPLIGLYSLQLYFSRHNCPSPFYLFVGKLFPSSFLMLRSLRSFVITSLITLLDQAFVSTLWSWPKYLKPAPSSELFKDLNYTKLFMTLWSSNMLPKSDTTTHPVNHTLPLSADAIWHIISLDAGHVLQLHSKFFLIQELKILPWFLSKIRWLVMIGYSCLKHFHAAVMHALVALFIFMSWKYSGYILKMFCGAVV